MGEAKRRADEIAKLKETPKFDVTPMIPKDENGEILPTTMVVTQEQLMKAENAGVDMYDVDAVVAWIIQYDTPNYTYDRIKED